MSDSFDVYNNTGSDIIFGSYTCPASSYVAIADIDVKSICQMPFFQVNVIDSNVGISVYSIDLGYGLGSAADIWTNRVANGALVY